MKIVRNLLVAMLGLVAVTPGVRADPDPSDPANDPNLQVDPDGVPLSISRPKAAQLSPEEIAEIRKQQAQAELDKTWLLRTYEKQLQANASGKSVNGESANLYYELSTNKELAKLAGLPEIDSGQADRANPYHVGETAGTRYSAAPQPDASPPLPGATLQASFYLKPFIAPLSMPSAAGLSDFYTSQPAQAVPRSALNRDENPGDSEDPTDIETPGMIAADKNPTANSLDLSLDVLPGESLEHARAHQDSDELLTLPLPMSADQLHLSEAATLSPPSPNVLHQTAPATKAAPAPPIPVNDADAPIPASQIPVINPVRAPIPNPFDILNR